MDQALSLLYEALSAPHRAELVAEEFRSVAWQIWNRRHRIELEAVMQDILDSSSSPGDLARIEKSLERWQDDNGFRPR